MKRKHLIHIVNEYHSKLKTHLRQIATDFDEDAIHDFRVDYKKMRAFLRMLRTGTQQKAVKIHKKLKAAYTHAGAIRDLQLLQKRIQLVSDTAHATPVEYLHLLGQTINALKPEFLCIYLQRPVSTNKKKTRADLSKKVRQLDYQAFAREKQTAIQSIIKGSLITDEDMHSIRKMLKDIHYNAPPDTEEENRQQLDTLLDKLGHFQDDCRAIILTDTYRLRHISLQEISLLSQIKTTWIEEKLRYKKVIAHSLPVIMATVHPLKDGR